MGNQEDSKQITALARALKLISEHGYDDDTPAEDALADFDNMRGIALRALAYLDAIMKGEEDRA
jgi:hypothetical protein